MMSEIDFMQSVTPFSTKWLNVAHFDKRNIKYNDYSLKILFSIAGKYVRNPTLGGEGAKQISF